MEYQSLKALDLSKIDTPAILILTDVVRENIKNAVTICGADRLRPHVKTCKSEGAIRAMLQASITKFKCATIAEAELLATCGARDVLLAYQPQGPKISRLLTLVEHFPNTTFSCLTDNLTAAEAINDVFKQGGKTIRVFIDMNVGMNRTGIAPGGSAIELYKYISSAPALTAGGVHAYDGHVRETDPIRLKEACELAFRPVDEMISQLKQLGLLIPTVVAGGSVSFPVHALRSDVECSPGTFIYWDKSYMDICPQQPFKPAVFLVTRVISNPATGVITTDLGHKSVAAENDIKHRVFFPEYPDLQPTGQSEEHLVLKAFETKLHTGDILFGIPWHVCPTIALYETAHTVSGNTISGEWRAVARDRRINF